MAATLVDKIWGRHVVRELSDGRTLLHIDRHILHDGTSRQAFDGMRQRGLKVRNPDLNLAVVDHIVATLPGRTGETNPSGRERIHALRANAREFGVTLYDVDDPRQGSSMSSRRSSASCCPAALWYAATATPRPTARSARSPGASARPR